MRRLLAYLSVASVLLLIACSGPAVAAGPRPAAPPPVRHVFVIVLENEGYAGTFEDPSADPYLARTLPSEGALLENYYGIGHVSLDNYIAMISGQAPNVQTSSDCQIYTQFVGAGTAADGQAIGTGCVFPATVATLANQLTAKHFTWKGYMEDMGNVASREAPVCGHPTINSQDHTQTAVSGDGYASRHDPFVYFSSITADAAYCDAHVVPLGRANGALPAGTPKGTTGLATDLKKASTTPNFVFITPNLCDDGHDYPCTNQKSGASALADIDTFLETWVPKITSSPAYKQNGMLVITFDESDGPQSDSTACCNEKPGPTDPEPGLTGPGGGRIGAIVLSPWTKGGTVDTVDYNHYALLASIENLFGLARLGYAATVPKTFGADVFNRH